MKCALSTPPAGSEKVPLRDMSVLSMVVYGALVPQSAPELGLVKSPDGTSGPVADADAIGASAPTSAPTAAAASESLVRTVAVPLLEMPTLFPFLMGIRNSAIHFRKARFFG
ncbi:hypothetical protein SCOCK_140143 [Actinacidiphila cocklensis]|uniref:Uncharacterized protein n=1 Tax=Actinacidiphila cocklensis TaxID=887465 RepID=A0A9W4DL25_9ACTN|nr:hypothetical protein SCOCK_140143 [Actinacidiphila cocklensis]